MKRLGVRSLLCLLVAVMTPMIAGAQTWVLDGEVVDSAGEAVDGVDIDIYEAGGGAALTLSADSTGVDGLFSLTVLVDPPVGFFDIVLKAPVGSNFIDQTIPDVFLFGSTDLGQFTLQVGWLVSGQVVDEAGVGIPDIDLEFLDEVGTDVNFANDNTDADGYFSVEVDEGVWDILFREVSAGPSVYVRVLLEAESILADTDLGLVTLRTGYSVTGLVENDLGAAVVGADLDVFDSATGLLIQTPGDTTDALGEFDLLLPEGEVSFEIRPPAGDVLVPQAFLFTVDAALAVNDTGTTVLPDGVLVSGVVQDDALFPAPGVDLDFAVSTTQEEIITLDDNSDGAGAFAVVVGSGTYDIRFRPTFASGLAPLVLADTELLVTTDLGDVALSAGLVLSGNITDGVNAVFGAEVLVSDPGTGIDVYVFGNLSDILGDYGFRQVSGTYDVRVIPPLGSGFEVALLESVELLTDTTQDLTLSRPPAVTDLSCTALDPDVTLTWTNGAADYDGLTVLRDGVVVASPTGGETSITELGLSDGSFVYEVRALRGVGESEPSVCEVEIGLVTEPVTALSCTVDLSDVTLNWTNGATDYDSIEILRGGALVESIAGDATTYLDPALDDETHTFDVRAVRGGVAAFAESCDAVVDTVVPAISALECTATGADVDLSWTSGAADYSNVEIRRDSILLEALLGDATSYLDSALSDGTYLYEIVATRVGIEAIPVSCTVIVDTATPAVTDLLCSVDGADVSLSWINGATDYDGVDVLRDGVFLDTLLGDATIYSDLAVADGTYLYEIVATRGGILAAAVSCTVTVDTATPAVTDLLCSVDGADVSLSWSNPATDYDGIDVLRDGVVLESLLGDATSYLDSMLADGTYEYEVVAIRGGLESTAVACTSIVTSENSFIRGDSNSDGIVNLADTIFIIRYQFLDGAEPTCFRSTDVGDDGSVDIADAIAMLQWLFGPGSGPADPYPDCGIDTTDDTLTCDTPTDGC